MEITAATPIAFRFTGIQIMSKSMSQPPLDGTAPNAFNFEIKVESKVNAEKKLVMPFVSVIIRDESRIIEFASIVIAFLFEIVDFDKVILLNEDKLYTIPPVLDATLRAPVISTSRGIIYSEFRGTYLNNAIMPIVYMDAFKPEQISDPTKANTIQKEL